MESNPVPWVICSDITAQTDLKINCECCVIRKCGLKKLDQLQMSFDVVFLKLHTGVKAQMKHLLHFILRCPCYSVIIHLPTKEY